MNNGTAIATVETLVAEVRVLMVGSRQVTLSVARQLDRVRLENMEAFGRVKLGDGENFVIGRECATGTLVLARYHTHPTDVVWLDEHLGFERKFTVCRRLLRDRNRDAVMLKFGERQLEVALGLIEQCAEESHGSYYRTEKCEHWDHHGQQALVLAEIAKHDEWRMNNLRMAEMPLIVLAGLR